MVGELRQLGGACIRLGYDASQRMGRYRRFVGTSNKRLSSITVHVPSNAFMKMRLLPSAVVVVSLNNLLNNFRILMLQYFSWASCFAFCYQALFVRSGLG